MKHMNNNLTRNVLLVEDDPKCFNTFTSLLDLLGLTVLQNESQLPVATYDDAIKILTKSGKTIEFALIDINLPGKKNGVDIADYILLNDYPIRIIFTTSDFSSANDRKLGEVGTQYGIIAKPDSSINPEVALFQLRQLMMPANPLLLYKRNVVWFMVQKLELIPDGKKQIYPRGEGQFPRQIIPVNEIAFICTGKGEFYNVPKNYSLIVLTNPRIGYYLHGSLGSLINKELDDRFIKVNKNACINIINCTKKVYSIKKNHIVVCGFEIGVSKKYRIDFNKRLAAYKLI